MGDKIFGLLCGALTKPFSEWCLSRSRNELCGVIDLYALDETSKIVPEIIRKQSSFDDGLQWFCVTVSHEKMEIVILIQAFPVANADVSERS